MSRLYLQIWLALLGILALFAALVAVAWWMLPNEEDAPRFAEGVSALVAEALGPAATPDSEQQARLDRIGKHMRGDVTVRSAQGRVIAVKGEALPWPEGGVQSSGVVHRQRHGPVFALKLDDGRTVFVQGPHRPHPHRLLLPLLLLLVTTAAGAYFVVRRLTRRLEVLRARVEALGQGDMSTRVAVEGRDEVARLARSFNDTAERIERLVQSQRSLLANASHELRSPLSRMRMAIELLRTQPRDELFERIARDIAELDHLIGDLLESGRLDARGAVPDAEAFDLLAVVAEEAAAHGLQATGVPVAVRGDRRAIGRVVRNLIENARRYAPGRVPDVSVGEWPPQGACIEVADRGPGIAESERERIFEPFYRAAGTVESGEGAGLGLALVRQIARLHGGEAQCLPRPGGGSIFRVTLKGAAAEGGRAA